MGVASSRGLSCPMLVRLSFKGDYISRATIYCVITVYFSILLQEVLSNVLSDPKGKFGYNLVKDFKSFSQNLQNYTHYAVQDIEPVLISCLQQESNSSICPPTQQGI